MSDNEQAPAKDFTSLCWAPPMLAVLSVIIFIMSEPVPALATLTLIVSLGYLVVALFLAVRHAKHRRRLLRAGIVGGSPLLVMLLGTMWALSNGIHF